MDKDPDNLDKALQFVKIAVTNQKVILGSLKPDVKRVTFTESDPDLYEAEDNSSLATTTVRALYKKDTGELNMSNFEARLKKTENDLEETKANVKQILGILRSRPVIGRSGSIKKW